MAALETVGQTDATTLGSSFEYLGTLGAPLGPPVNGVRDFTNVAGNGATLVETPRPKRDEHGVLNVRPTAARATDAVSELTMTVSHKTDARTPSAVLDEATAALRRLAVEQSSEDSEWAAAARLLRSAALDRRVAAPRVASVALLASDAILFTPREQALTHLEPLTATIRLLLEPFVSQEAEERVFDAFLDAGWEITPFYEEDGDELSDL